MVFLYRSNADMVRRVLYADHIRSRTKRSDAALNVLNRHGRRIVVIELDGPIFFGSAETVAGSVENELPGADWIVLDLKYAGHFDSSGVMMLKRLDDKMLKLNKRLLLSYLPADGNQQRFLKTIGLTRPKQEAGVPIVRSGYLAGR